MFSEVQKHINPSYQTSVLQRDSFSDLHRDLGRVDKMKEFLK